MNILNLNVILLFILTLQITLFYFLKEEFKKQTWLVKIPAVSSFVMLICFLLYNLHSESYIYFTLLKQYFFGRQTSSQNYILFFLFVTGAIILIIGSIFRLKSNNPEAHGSAHWMTLREMITNKMLKLRKVIKEGEFLLGKEGVFKVVLPKPVVYQHIMILGPSGTGKSRSFFMPNLKCVANQVSAFVHDTKGELWDTTSGYWKKAYRLAPSDPEYSTMGFNWVPLCKEGLLSLELARCIVSNGEQSKMQDPFWEDSETALLSGVFSHVAYMKNATPATVYEFIMNFSVNQIIRFLKNSQSKHAREQAYFIEDAAEPTRASILTVLRRSLVWLADEKVQAFTSNDIKPVDLGLLRKEAVAFYWVLPVSVSEVLRPLTCLAIKLLLYELRKIKGIPVYMFLDEFDALGKIPKIESEITLLRAEKVSIISGIQSVAQLKKTYNEAHQIILDNSQTKIVLDGLEFDTAEIISKNLGEYTHCEKSYNHSWNNGGFLASLFPSVSVSNTMHGRRLMTADEIRRLNPKQTIIISRNSPPMKIYKNFFSNQQAKVKPLTPKKTKIFKAIVRRETTS